MRLPKRSQEHQTETESMNQLREQLGSDWVFRDHSERDYGIDVHIEYFERDWPTGLVFYGQLKGTKKIMTEPVKFKGFSTKTANYANFFNIPFFLFYASIESKVTKFIWLQEYLRINIMPSDLSKQDSITIDFPIENELNEAGKRKILGIIKQEHRAKSELMFLTYYERLLQRISKLANGDLNYAKSCLTPLLEIKRLNIIENSESNKRFSIKSMDFERACSILSNANQRNYISSDELHELKILINPLKYKKLEILNSDVPSMINSWMYSEKHY